MEEASVVFEHEPSKNHFKPQMPMDCILPVACQATKKPSGEFGRSLPEVKILEASSSTRQQLLCQVPDEALIVSLFRLRSSTKFEDHEWLPMLLLSTFLRVSIKLALV